MKGPHRSILAGIPAELPALTRARKLQQRAARVGFDWPDMPPVLAKVREELAELEVEINTQASRERQQEELGDLLFAVANLARKLRIDPERALQSTNRKFTRRFGKIEMHLASQGKSPAKSSLAEMDAIWERAKHDES